MKKIKITPYLLWKLFFTGLFIAFIGIVTLIIFDEYIYFHAGIAISGICLMLWTIKKSKRYE